MKHNSTETSEEWDKLAKNHIESYSNLYPRYGFQIKQTVEKYHIKPKRILEVAAFSAKDSRFLAAEFPDCEFHTVNFSQEAVYWAKEV